MKLPICIDYLEDNTRCRIINVCVAVVLYSLAVFQILINPVKQSQLIDRMEFSSQLPTKIFVGLEAGRGGIQVIAEDGLSLTFTNVSTAVSSIFVSDSGRSLPCDTLVQEILRDTLKGERLREACRTEILNTQNQTNALGVAGFTGLTVKRGPPGTYTFHFRAGNNSTLLESTVAVESKVFEMEVLQPPPPSVSSGVPLAVQPKVKLAGLNGEPLVGRSVVAFSWTGPRFHRDEAGSGSSKADNELSARRRSRHHPGGQKLALFHNAVSLPSDANGVASFRGLTVTSSTSQWVYIMFYCEGSVLSWHTVAAPAAASAQHMGKLPQFDPPILFKGATSSVALTVPPAASVLEGTPFQTAPKVTVTAVNGQPRVGSRVFALLHSGAVPDSHSTRHTRHNSAAGSNDEVTELSGAVSFVYPQLYVPTPHYSSTVAGAAAAAVGAGTSKTLQHAISAVTNEKGEATFPALRFSTAGRAGPYRIVFVCEGVSSAPSPLIHVGSSVTQVSLSQAPHVLLSTACGLYHPLCLYRGLASDVADFMSGGGDSATRLPASSPLLPVAVRAENAAGEGVAGKALDVQVVFASAGDSTPLKRLPVAPDYLVSVSIYPDDTTGSSGSEGAFTGSDGFVRAQLFLNVLDDGWSQALAAAGADYAMLRFSIDDIAHTRVNAVGDNTAPPSGHSKASDAIAPFEAEHIAENTCVRLLVAVPPPALLSVATSPPVLVKMAIEDERLPPSTRIFTNVPSLLFPSEVELEAVDSYGAPVSGVSVELQVLSTYGFDRRDLHQPTWVVNNVSSDADGVITLPARTHGISHGPPGSLYVRYAQAGGSEDSLCVSEPLLVTVRDSAAARVQLMQATGDTPLSTHSSHVTFDAPKITTNTEYRTTLKITDDAGTPVSGYFAHTRLTALPSYASIMSLPPLTALVATPTHLELASDWVTVKQPLTGSAADGTIPLSIIIKPGRVGAFTLLFSVAGAAALPLSMYALSRATSIAISQQPGTGGHSTFLVGDFFSPQPAVTVTDASGAALEGYVVLAEFVPAAGASPAAFAVPDAAMTARQTVFSGMRASDRSNASGAAVFSSLGVFAAATGCYRARFFAAEPRYPSTAAGAAASRVSGGVGASAQWAESVLSDPFCVRNNNTYRIVAGPSPLTAGGATLPIPPLAQIQISSARQPDLVAQSGVLAIHALVTHYNGVALSRAQSLRLSSKVLENNLCVMVDSSAAVGGCSRVLHDNADGSLHRYSFAFSSLRWRRSVHGERIKLGLFSTLVEHNPAGAVHSADSRSVAITALPALLSIIQDPPAEVWVGAVFPVAVTVTIANGAPLPNRKVTVTVLDAAGPVETAAQFMARTFSDDPVTTAKANSFPVIPARRTVALTDVDGTARFSLRIDAGSPGRFALLFSASSAKSPKSTPFQLFNEVQTVVFLPADAKLIHAVSSFPTQVPLGVLRMKASTTDGSPALSQDGFSFKVQKLQPAAADTATTEPRTDELSLQQLADDPSAALSSAVSAANQTLSEFLDTASSSQARLTMLWRLLVQGGRRLRAYVPARTYASVSYTHSSAGNGTYSFHSPELDLLGPGVYRVWGSVAGVQTSEHMDIIVAQKGSPTAGERAMESLLHAAMVLLALFLFLGNSGFNHRATVLLSLLVSIGSLTLVGITAKAYGPQSAIVLLFSLSIVILVYCGLALCLLQKSEALCHYSQRRVAFECYVARMFRRRRESSLGTALRSLTSKVLPIQPSVAALASKGGGDGDGSGLCDGEEADGGIEVTSLDVTQFLVTPCARCTDKEAEVTCTTCTAHLCKDCSLLMHRGSLLYSHGLWDTVVPLSGTAAAGGEGEGEKAGPIRFIHSRSGTLVRPVSGGVSRSYAVQAALVLRGLMDHRDAFFYPQRLVTAFVLSVLANVSFMVVVVQAVYNANVQVTKLQWAGLQSLFKFLVQLESLYYAQQAVDLSRYDELWADQQAIAMYNEFRRFSNAVSVSFLFGSFLGIIFYTLSWAVLLLDFRMQVLRARHGEFDFNPVKTKLFDASNYPGIQISNGIMTFLIVTAISGLSIFPLVYGHTRELVVSRWKELLALIVPMLLNIVVKKYVGGKLLTNRTTVLHRRWYALYDFVQFFLQMFTGIAKAIIRFLVVIVAMLLSLPRVDRSPFPAWVERYTLLDSGSKSYHGVIMMHHTFNHPIFRVAAWKLAEDSAHRREVMAGTANQPPGAVAYSPSHSASAVVAESTPSAGALTLIPATYTQAAEAAGPPPVSSGSSKRGGGSGGGKGRSKRKRGKSSATRNASTAAAATTSTAVAAAGASPIATMASLPEEKARGSEEGLSRSASGRDQTDSTPLLSGGSSSSHVRASAAPAAVGSSTDWSGTTSPIAAAAAAIGGRDGDGRGGNSGSKDAEQGNGGGIVGATIVSRSRQRAFNRWHVAVTLWRYPSLRQYRKAVLASRRKGKLGGVGGDREDSSTTTKQHATASGGPAPSTSKNNRATTAPPTTPKNVW